MAGALLTGAADAETGAEAAPKSLAVGDVLLAAATLGDGLAVRRVPATFDAWLWGRTPIATAAIAMIATAPSALAPARRCWRRRAPAWMRSIASGGTGTPRPRECRTSRSLRSKSSGGCCVISRLPRPVRQIRRTGTSRGEVTRALVMPDSSPCRQTNPSMRRSAPRTCLRSSAAR